MVIGSEAGISFCRLSRRSDKDGGIAESGSWETKSHRPPPFGPDPDGAEYIAIRPEQEDVVTSEGMALIASTRSRIGASTEPFGERSV